MGIQVWSKKQFSTILFALYLIITAYALYIGIVETMYSLGLYVVLIIHIIGLLLFGIAFVLTKRVPAKSLQFAGAAVVFIQLVWIVSHRIEKYVPNHTITIPYDYQGVVYLFVTNDKVSDIEVQENGIGYIAHEGRVAWEVKRGDATITEVLNRSRFDQISFEDSLQNRTTVYSVLCFAVADTDSLSVDEWNFNGKPCISAAGLQEMFKEGSVKEAVLRKMVWEKTGQ